MSEKRKHKALNIIIDVIVIIILVFALFLAVNTIVSKAQGNLYTSIGKNAYAVVQSDSMDGVNDQWSDNLSSLKQDYQGKWADGFAKGDIIIVKILSDEEKSQLKVGDVITFKFSTYRGEALNTHRIISISDNGEITTHGDNTEGADSKIFKNEIVGKYEGSKIAGIGNINLFVSTKVGFFVCIVLPTLLVVAYCVVKVVFACREDKKEKAMAQQQETNQKVEEKEKMRQEILKEIQQNKTSESAPEKQEKAK